nr:hypothetical protein CFP56_02820 [Quercus suber]
MDALTIGHSSHKHILKGSRFPTATRETSSNLFIILSRSVILLAHIAKIAMPSLNLQLRLLSDDRIAGEMFPFVESAVESGDEDALRNAADKIACILFEYNKLAERFDFGAILDLLFLELAEQIPYESEKMLDLLRLLKLVHTSPILAVKLTGGMESMTSCFSLHVRDSDHLSACEEQDFSRCLSWHAFISHLYQNGLVIGSSAPVGFLNEMLESKKPHVHSEENIRKLETRTMAASQYILRWGSALLEHLLTTYNSSNPAFDHNLYSYTGRGAQGLKKWHIWRETLHKITAGGWDESERSISTEAEKLFTRVVKLMDEIEAELAPQTK